MAEKRSGHLLSGEILEAAPGLTNPRAASVASRHDVVDAEYETLAGPRGPQAAAPATPAVAAAAALSGLDMLRSGRGTAQRPAMPGRSAFWAAVLLALAGIFWISGGHAMLGRAVADREPAAPLRISELNSRLEGSGERRRLVIDGEAVNEGVRTHKLPDLSIDILDGDGRTMHYFLGTRGRPLAAGERFAFSSRLAAPKDGVKSVSVTFRLGEPKE